MDENIKIYQCTGIDCYCCIDTNCPIVQRSMRYKTFIDPTDKRLLEENNNEEKTAD